MITEPLKPLVRLFQLMERGQAFYTCKGCRLYISNGHIWLRKVLDNGLLGKVLYSGKDIAEAVKILDDYEGEA